MKKHYFTPLLGTAVLGLSIYMGYRTYNAYTAIGKNKLFLENIEALATEEEDKPTCGTRTEYINNTITCPICGAKTGFVGTEYSRQEKGGMSVYREGLVGTETTCTPYHGMQTKINTVQIKNC